MPRRILAGLGSAMVVLGACWAIGSPLDDEPGFGPGAAAKPSQAAKTGLSMQFLQNPQGPPTILLLDPLQEVLAVYHVDPATGRISLKSVRRVRYDLRMDQFETDKPLPTELRDAQR